MSALKRWLLGERNQLGRRLIVYIIAFSSLITLLTSLVQLAAEYRGLRSELDEQLESVSIFVPSIAGSVWNFDQPQVQRALDALILLPHVARVTVVASDTGTRWSAGAKPAENVINRSYSLHHDVRGNDGEIGRLEVVASLDGIYRQVATSALSIVLGNAVKTLVVVVFMVILMRRLVTARLDAMGAKVRELLPRILPLRRAVEAQPQSLPAAFDELDAVDWVLDKTAEDLAIAVNALATLNAELEQRVAERTKDLESFSYSVSHDLRTPLRAIDGFSRILLEDYGDTLDAEGQRLLTVVRTNTVRMGQLIDDILEFSRMGRRDMSTTVVDLEGLVRKVFGDLQGVIGDRHLDLRVGSLAPARGDYAMLRQVFDNLLSNAVKFTRGRDPAVIEISCAANGGEHVYCVKDNGVGFDMRYVGKLFSVFERLHSSAEFEGTGIGLAIVKRVITRHGGRVWATSVLDQGTSVYFTLVRETELETKVES